MSADNCLVVYAFNCQILVFEANYSHLTSLNDNESPLDAQLPHRKLQYANTAEDGRMLAQKIYRQIINQGDVLEYDIIDYTDVEQAVDYKALHKARKLMRSRR